MKRKSLSFAKQSWEHILFLHWPFPKHVIERLIEDPFELDTFNGKPWVTIVLFRATNSKFHFTPKWMAFPPVTQVNIRTYVKLKNSEQEEGVYFFSLNVNSIIATFGATYFLGLPFNNVTSTSNIQYSPLSIIYDVQHKQEILLHVNYVNKSNECHIVDDQLSQFLTERYCIWTKRNGRILKVPITHSRWTLEKAEVQLYMNEQITESFDKFIPLEMQKACMSQLALAHYSSFKQEQVGLYR